MRHRIAVCILPWLFAACSFSARSLPSEAPPLSTMDEPPALLTEPADEAERAALAPGTFSGIEVADARASLDALLEAPPGLSVSSVVENSPAVQAGIAEGDLLLSARILPDGEERVLAWPAQWREIELESPPGTEVELELDRAGTIQRARVSLVPRLRPAQRIAVARLREEERAGIVVRGASEVEARPAGLAPGAGAVVVGLSGDSPWRKADLRFEDLIVRVDGQDLAAPDVLIERIRAAPEGAKLRLEIRRHGQPLELLVPLSQRVQEVTEISIPLLFSYERSRRASETSLLAGAFRLQRTPTAWSLRLLWLFRFSGGDADRLEEVGS